MTIDSYAKKPLRIPLGLALSLVLSGCAGMPAQPGGAVNHPASAGATDSPQPPWEPRLLAITNIVPVKPGTGPAREHQHGHGSQETKPRTEENK